MQSWERGFVNVIHPFKEGHEIDRMNAVILVLRPGQLKNSDETQSSNSLRAIVLFWEDTSALLP